MRNRIVWLVLLALAALAVCPLAAAPAANLVIGRGVDIFSTPANGKTFYDFKQNPIPAGFFCKSSAPFSGRVVLKGLPIATDVRNALHGADTVVERLDDASFDTRGVATTRIRLKAISLVSIEPIRTACGDYHVYLSLDGTQRVTKMRIARTEEEGGTFSAPISVRGRMTFIPAGPEKGRAIAPKLVLKGDFSFPPAPIPWSFKPGPGAKRFTTAMADTNGDLQPDTQLFAGTNFAPGWSPRMATQKSCMQCEPPICHEDQGKYHCTGGVVACYPAACP